MHENVNVFYAIELNTYKWLKWYICYVCFTTTKKTKSVCSTPETNTLIVPQFKNKDGKRLKIENATPEALFIRSRRIFSAGEAVGVGQNLLIFTAQ